MKTSKYLKTIAFCAVMLAAALPGKAQIFPNTYINVDWQLGVPLGSDFADKTSGWGMNFEGGYFVTPAITVGPFISYQTNLQSISRQTLDLGGGSALTTNQKHALFQLPFGVTGRYNWLTDSVFQPYAGLKLGASYAEMSSYYYVVKQYTDTWGFFVSPEIGVSIFPRPDYRLGFHVALYYSYATNSGDVLTYSINNINNFGIREMLDCFIEIAPTPLPRETEERVVQPDEEKFTGFVFKIHANMDPNHRDRIAFVKVCSGTFHRNTNYLHVGLGKNLKFSTPTAFMASKKSIIDEAYPGDIVGLHDTGNFKIGDTLTEGEKLHFKGIPSFSPELFKYIENADPMKSKQLAKGIDQLMDEGVAQLFTNQFNNRKIIGTVGALQFEVIERSEERRVGKECRSRWSPYH